MLKKERRMTNTLRVAAVLFSLVFSLFLWQQQAIEAFAQGTAEVLAESGKIREQANTGSTVLASVKKGDKLDVTASTTDSSGYTWYKVFINREEQGYIRGDLVSVAGTIPAEKAGSTGSTSTTTASASTDSGGGGNVTTVGSGGNVTTVGSGGNTTTVGSGGSTTTAQSDTTVAGDTAAADTGASPSQVLRAKTTAQVRVRKGAGTTYDVAGSANASTEVAVSGEASDAEGKLWYQVSFTQSGTTINGFIREDFLEILETAPAETPEEVIETEPVVEDTPAVNEDYYLKYMQNEEGGWDWYLFDQIQGTSQSLTQLLNAVAQLEEGETAENNQVSVMKIIIIGMAVVLVLLVVAVTFLLFKLRDSYEEYDDEEDEEEDEEDEDEEEPAPVRSRRPRFGRRAQQAAVEDDEEDEDEDEEEEEVVKKPSVRQGKNKTSAQSKGTWQSRDFLELDDDMEFEFLDL